MAGITTMFDLFAGIRTASLGNRQGQLLLNSCLCKFVSPVFLFQHRVSRNSPIQMYVPAIHNHMLAGCM